MEKGKHLTGTLLRNLIARTPPFVANVRHRPLNHRAKSGIGSIIRQQPLPDPPGIR